jgi:hypothetical protein
MVPNALERIETALDNLGVRLEAHIREDMENQAVMNARLTGIDLDPPLVVRLDRLEGYARNRRSASRRTEALIASVLVAVVAELVLRLFVK